MASSIITGLMLFILYGCNAGASDDVPSVSSSSIYMYGCSYCCSRIDNQTTILNRLSSANNNLTKDVGELKTGVLEDLPNRLERQAVVLDALKTSVVSDIPSQLEAQSSELRRIKTSISDIATTLNVHSEELIMHDGRLKEQGLLLTEINRLVKELHDSLIGPKDCSDIRALGHNASGVYRVYPGSLAKRIQADVYCDMTTPGGSWLVFQRRKDGSVNFEQPWIEYVNGFGQNQTGEFWLGNELLYLLTSNRKYKLRIDMEDFDGQKRYVEYSTFSISSSADRYRLKVTGYTGDAGDSFTGHGGYQFSTKDSDNDIYPGSCSQEFHGAWWYSKCHGANLNGLYLRGPHTSYADGIEWYAFRGYYYSLKTTEMKIAVAD